MSGIIYTDLNTTFSHGKFISWLNSLLANYQNGFWDGAVGGILQLSFIRKHRLLLQELYVEEDSQEPNNFLTVLPTDSANNILMVHSMDGVPYLYNDEEIGNIFEFDTNGTLKHFYQNVSIWLKNSDGVVSANLHLNYRKICGVKVPFLNIQDMNNQVISIGILDVPYKERESGSYQVDTIPLDEVRQISIKNITKVVMKISIPLLEKLVVDFVIRPNEYAVIPYTETSEYFVRNSMENKSFEYKIN